MFMHKMHTPLEGQQKLQGMADGGVPYATGGPVAAPNGNVPPIGSGPENVADDIDAKLSKDELVIPADVVKFFGVGHFYKQITQAKQKMLEMAQQGFIKGNGPPVPNSPSQATQGPSPSAATPPGQSSGPPQGAAAGGFFAPIGHPANPATFAMGGFQNYANGGYENYTPPNANDGGEMAKGGFVAHMAAGGLAPDSLSLPTPTAAVAAPSMKLASALPIAAPHASPISGKIPHNTGILHTGVHGPFHNNTSVTHGIMSHTVPATVPKLFDGGFLGTNSSGYSAGGMAGGNMVTKANPTMPMTAAQDPNHQMPKRPYPTQGQSFMTPYS